MKGLGDLVDLLVVSSIDSRLTVEDLASSLPYNRKISLTTGHCSVNESMNFIDFHRK